MKKYLIIAGILLLAFSCSRKEPAHDEPTPTPTPTPAVQTVPSKPVLLYDSLLKPLGIRISFSTSTTGLLNIYRSLDGKTKWEKVFSDFKSGQAPAVDVSFPRTAKILFYRLTFVDEKGTESAPSEVASVNIVVNPTATWKTFTSPPFNFLVKFPPTWVLKAGTGVIYMDSPKNQQREKDIAAEKISGGFAHDIIINYWEDLKAEAAYDEALTGGEEKFEAAKSLEDMIKRRPDYLTTEGIKQIDLAGQKAYTYIAGGLGRYYTILIEHKGHIYQIRFGNRASASVLDSTEKLILTTFKFLN